MEAIEIRFMREEDISQIAELEKQSFSRPWTLSAISESFHNQSYLFVVAVSQACVIGYAGMYQVLDEGNITNVAVLERYRRQNIGTLLLKYLFDAAKERGVIRIALEVRASNIGAVKLYGTLGFSDCGIRKNFYERPLEDAIIMWKDVI